MMGKLLCILLICGLTILPMWLSGYHRFGPTDAPPCRNGDIMHSPIRAPCRVQNVRWVLAKSLIRDKETGQYHGGHWAYDLVPVE